MKASFRVAAPSTADYDTDDNKPTDQHNTLPTSMTVPPASISVPTPVLPPELPSAFEGGHVGVGKGLE